MKSKIIKSLIKYLQKYVSDEPEKSITDFEYTGGGKNSININGRQIYTDGNSISVINDKVYVDGRLLKDGLKGIVKIEWSGPLANVDCTSLVVNGDVQGDVDATTVSITGSVQGDVDGTSIKIGGDVGKNVDGTTISVGGVVQGRVRR